MHKIYSDTIYKQKRWLYMYIWLERSRHNYLYEIGSCDKCIIQSYRKYILDQVSFMWHKYIYIYIYIRIFEVYAAPTYNTMQPSITYRQYICILNSSHVCINNYNWRYESNFTGKYTVYHSNIILNSTNQKYVHRLNVIFKCKYV